MVKYLIIRFSSIGDIVLTTPVIRCLKNQVEEAKIYYLTKKQFAPILEHNPYIDKIYKFDNNLKEIIKEIENEEIHYIIDLHKNIRSKTVERKLKLVSFSFNKLNFKKWLITNFKINRLPNKHIVDRYLETTKIFDVTNDNKGLDYFLSENDQVNISSLPEDFNKGYITFVIGAKHNTKKLTNEKIISLCNKINYPIILLGGKEDVENAEIITKLAKGNIYNACGKYSINQSASLVQQSKIIVTHDTGLMHIAAAFKKNIISIWGNTIPEFGMSAYLPGDLSKIFEVKNLSCRPCSKLGKQTCPKKHFKCMNDIDLEEVRGYINNCINT